MNQQWLMNKVLQNQDAVPSSPDNGRAYLSLAQAQEIVEETVNYLGEYGDETEYEYIRGHKKRLAHSLSMIPKAQGDQDSCLDVGCYGYMLLWAKKYLGYERVVGVEWHPDIKDDTILRRLQVNDYSIEIVSHNFDISSGNWPIDEVFQTVLMFEVLEHINHDPMGVMEQLHSKLEMQGTLVMSVPNAVSYKTLREFLVGMPPWTYWFYEPDLSHEPRHCFEYTPLVFKTLIQSSGMAEYAFRTIYAYTEPEHESTTIEIAKAMGYSEVELGETMIINSTKITESIPLRYPDVIYSPTGYYQNVYPLLQSKLQEVQENFAAAIMSKNDRTNLNQQIESLQVEKAKLETQLSHLQETSEQRITEYERSVNQLLFNCDCYLQNENKNQERVSAAEEALASAMIEIKDHKQWAESLTVENADLSSRVNELLFACDCYLQQVNDPARCVQVIREQHFRKALRVSKSIARKTPILRTALRPVYRNTKKFIKTRM